MKSIYQNHITYLVLFLVSNFSACGQTQMSMAEMLGYDAEDKLLIIHADDVGMAHSVNKASIEALEKGYINSASIMVPCPWFNEIVLYANDHPEKDLGLHLTLTSEWNEYKWGGVLPANQIASLLDERGYMYASIEDVYKNAKLEEVEAEIRAQIDKALAHGIKVSHLDSHMGTMYYNPDFFRIFIKVAKSYKIPAMIPLQSMRLFPGNLENIPEKSLVIDQIYMANDLAKLENDWEQFYLNILKNMTPGIHVMLVHLGYDNEELQTVCKDHPDYGSAWREADLKVLSSPVFQETLRKHNIRLVSWKELHKRHQSMLNN